jgi:hypothetical protein
MSDADIFHLRFVPFEPLRPSRSGSRRRAHQFVCGDIIQIERSAPARKNPKWISMDVKEAKREKTHAEHAKGLAKTAVGCDRPRNP